MQDEARRHCGALFRLVIERRGHTCGQCASAIVNIRQATAAISAIS